MRVAWLLVMGLVAGFMLGSCAAELKRDLSVRMTGHDSFSDVVKCIATGP